MRLFGNFQPRLQDLRRLQAPHCARIIAAVAGGGAIFCAIRGEPAVAVVFLVLLAAGLGLARLAETARTGEPDPLFALAPDFFCVTRTDGTLIRANPAFAAAAGFPAEALPGRLLADLFSPQDAVQMRCAFVSADPASAVETRWKAGDGTARIVSWTIFPDPGRGMVYAIGRDITQLKMEEELRRQALENAREANAESQRLAREANASNRAKSVFLAVMSHELRTPINGMLGSGQLLQTTALSGEQEEYTRILLHCGHSLKRLVNDLLDFSRIEAGTLSVSNEPFHLQTMLRQVVQTSVADALKKNLTLYHMERDLPKRVVGDELRLRQVLSNLINNAIKFTDHGNIVIRTKLVARAGREVELLFTVRDGGIGIPPELAEAIFDPFFQADSSPTRNYGGAGLGLAICRKLVAMMGGRIWVESEPGQGSLFSFTARLMADEEPAAPSPVGRLSAPGAAAKADPDAVKGG